MHMLPHRGESTSKPARALSEGASSPGRTAASFAVLVGRAVPAAGATGAILGGTYLAAWWSGAASRWSAAGVITMKTNMALSLVLAGGALLLLGTDEAAPKHRGAVTVGASVALLVGLLTLGEHLFRYDLGIDQLLAREAPGAAATASPNRMGMPGSACLALLGAGLVAAAWKRRIAP